MLHRSETIRRLSLHENIIGIKDATGEMNNLEEIKNYAETK